MNKRSETTAQQTKKEQRLVRTVFELNISIAFGQGQLLASGAEVYLILRACSGRSEEAMSKGATVLPLALIFDESMGFCKETSKIAQKFSQVLPVLKDSGDLQETSTQNVLITKGLAYFMGRGLVIAFGMAIAQFLLSLFSRLGLRGCE